MKAHGILNAELCHAVASLGHGDGLLVVDAGYPIPSNAWRIDLALTPNQPDLRTVLGALAAEMIVERIEVAADVATHNEPLFTWLESTWPGVPLDTRPHAEMLALVGSQAKAVVRTGAFDPWGNVLLVSGVDVPAFFAAPGVVVPEYYRDRIVAETETSA